MKVVWWSIIVSMIFGFISGILSFHSGGWSMTLFIGYIVGLYLGMKKELETIRELFDKWENDWKLGGWR